MQGRMGRTVMIWPSDSCSSLMGMPTPFAEVMAAALLRANACPQRLALGLKMA